MRYFFLFIITNIINKIKPYGLTAYIDQLIEAPQNVKLYLCSIAKVHLVVSYHN
jgi:hypothetical protein